MRRATIVFFSKLYLFTFATRQRHQTAHAMQSDQAVLARSANKRRQPKTQTDLKDKGRHRHTANNNASTALSGHWKTAVVVHENHVQRPRTVHPSAEGPSHRRHPVLCGAWRSHGRSVRHQRSYGGGGGHTQEWPSGVVSGGAPPDRRWHRGRLLGLVCGRCDAEWHVSGAARVWWRQVARRRPVAGDERQRRDGRQAAERREPVYVRRGDGQCRCGGDKMTISFEKEKNECKMLSRITGDFFIFVFDCFFYI